MSLAGSPEQLPSTHHSVSPLPTFQTIQFSRGVIPESQLPASASVTRPPPPPTPSVTRGRSFCHPTWGPLRVSDGVSKSTGHGQHTD